MRLIHTSDWHLGRALHGEPLLAHQEAFLEWLLLLAREEQVDAVVVAGDVYDRAVPSADAVALLDRTLASFAAAGTPIMLIAGNHDSAVRLGFGRSLTEAAGVHLRSSLDDLIRPVILSDADGPVGLYGIPYLLPDAVMADLDAERSHASVLAAAARRVLADASARGLDRTVVAAHAFVTGGAACESERDIRVGGIADAPAAALAGCTYLALGHLHAQQRIVIEGSPTTAGYSGSPLAFSFSEAGQPKSVTLVDIDGAGTVTTRLEPTPVPRPLREVRGRLEDLLARAGTDLADLSGAWVKAVLTDPARPLAPMERLRENWPHTLVLDFAPEGGLISAEADLVRLAQASDPVEICGLFVEYSGGVPPDGPQRAVLRAVVEAVQQPALEVAAASAARVPAPAAPLEPAAPGDAAAPRRAATGAGG